MEGLPEAQLLADQDRVHPLVEGCSVPPGLRPGRQIAGELLDAGPFGLSIAGDGLLRLIEDHGDGIFDRRQACHGPRL